MRLKMLVAVSLALHGSVASCTAAPPASAAQASILAGSTPAAGSTVGGPVDVLELRFAPPARLLEVTITDSSGQVMPMMVTAAGEVGDYSLPLSGLEPGRYSVAWRVHSGGAEHRGGFAFTVR